MDNGLIFPYRQTAHSEPVMLTTPTTHRGAFGLCTGCAAWDPNRELSVLTGVTQEGSRARQWN